jgi:hypothetical protein
MNAGRGQLRRGVRILSTETRGPMQTDEIDGLARYHAHGIAFEYPDVWELTEEAEDRDTVITVSVDGGSFWLLRILSDAPRPQDVLKDCERAFQDEYEDVESQPGRLTMLGSPAETREIQFSCYELLNTVWLSSVRVAGRTLLIWWQATDHELPVLRPHFERLSQSVRITDVSN